MKLLYFLLSAITLFFFGCTEEVETSGYIEDVVVTPTTVAADGTTIIEIKAFLNPDLDKRTVQFNVDKGVFQNSDKPNTITVTAEKLKDTLVAVARLKAPSITGMITISVQPDIKDLKGKFVVQRTVTVNASDAATIDLTANAFSVHNNFDGEIEVTGLLKNSDGNGVMKGVRVLIEDYDLNFNSLPGRFRNSSLTTGNDSKVSTFYTPGQIVPDQFIYLIGTILKADDTKTAYADTLKIFITEKD